VPSGLVPNKVEKCKVLKDHTYFWEKYNNCFAWTDDNDWEEKVNDLVRIYSEYLTLALNNHRKAI